MCRVVLAGIRSEALGKWRERINGWAKGQDTYKEMFDIAREIPETLLAEQVEPRRWWKA